LDQLRALSIEYLEGGDLAFNQGVPGSIPGRLTSKSSASVALPSLSDPFGGEWWNRRGQVLLAAPPDTPTPELRLT